MRIMIIFIILSSCSYYDSKKIKKNEIVIDKNISFNDFKKKNPDLWENIKLSKYK